MANTGRNRYIFVCVLAAAVLGAATNEPFIRSNSVEMVNAPAAGETNRVDITYSTKAAGDSLIVADYYEYKEKDIPLWRRSEIVFLIATPFTALYSFVALAPFDSDSFLFVPEITYFRNQTGLYVSSSLFYVMTTLLWSIAITIDDARSLTLKTKKTYADMLIPREWMAALDFDAERGVTLMVRHTF